MAKIVRRAYQDYSAWEAYGTRVFWQDIEQNPPLTAELVCQRLNVAGCVCPSERTCADIAAGILAATHGAAVAAVPDAEVQRVYTFVKAILRMRLLMHAYACTTMR